MTSNKRPDIEHVRAQLPAINDWVDATIAARDREARPLSAVCSDRFARHFTPATCASINVILARRRSLDYASSRCR
jgi:hypothetical protein